MPANTLPRKRKKLINLYNASDAGFLPEVSAPAYLDPRVLPRSGDSSGQLLPSLTLPPAPAHHGPPAVLPARRIRSAPVELEEDDAGLEVPNDTVLALQLLASQFPAAVKERWWPLVLRSQVYSLVEDRTVADRQLDELRQQQEVRVFKLTAAADVYALMFQRDYAAAIARSRQQLKEMGALPEVLAVLDWFLERVVPRHTDVCITRLQLMKLLTTLPTGKRDSNKVSEEQLGLLFNSGLLARHISDRDMYWFSLPAMGPVMKSITDGRKEVLTSVARKKYGEMFEAEMEARKLRNTILDARFHVRDLLGSGGLTRMQTTSGPLLRVVKKNLQ